MKNQYFKNGMLLLTFLLSSAWLNVAFAGNVKGVFKKEISKEYDISANGKVKILGKYGHINVTTWNKNKVKFDVIIEIKAPSKAKADQLFKKIHIKFSNSSNSAEAIFKREESKNWNNYKNVGYKIHYNVKLPAGCSVDLTNKYGDINIVDIKGRANLVNKYGNIKTGDIGKDVDFQLGYGKADLGNIGGNVNVTIKYSNLDIESAKNVKISSKYSKMHIDKAESIKSESKYDKYYLGAIGNLKNVGKYDDFEIQSVRDINATGKYSDYDIEELQGKASFDMGYGDANIKSVKNFKGIEFSGKHASLKVHLKGAGANFDIQGNYTKVKLPENKKNGNYRKENNEIKTDGQINGGGSTIKASSKYGSVVIYN